MAVEIVVSLITLAGSALGTLAGIMINSKLSNYRIEQLEKKVDKHNNLIERTYKIEQHNAVIDEEKCIHCGICTNVCQNNKEIKVANHRIDDLEEFHK